MSKDSTMHQLRVIESTRKGHARNGFAVEFDWLRVQRPRSDWLKLDG